MADAQLVKDFDATSRAQFVPDFGAAITPPVAIQLGHQILANQYMPIAASRLNGVLQQ
jgi:hypothetical protein